MPFSLLVRRSPEGDSVEVTVNADDTVDALARLAAASFSKEGGAATVCFCGQVLRPEATLASAGVTAAHFVVLCFPDKQRAVGAAALRGRPQAQPPRAAPAPPRAAPSLRRVCSGKGWVVHGLLLEYSDGVRTGFFGENDGSPLPLSDDAALLRRGGVWQEVSPGEDLVSISGHNSTMGYLCGAITLRLSSGRAIECKGENANVFGAPFTHHAAASPGGYLEPTFADGRCTSLRPLSRPPPQLAPAARPAATGPPPRVINSVAELLAWRPPAAAAAAARVASAPAAPLPSRPRVLHCHDMAGGYNQLADDTYLRAFSGWGEIDVFVYFAHNRVSMPPQGWVEACHAHGVPCLATIITEQDDGENDALLSHPEAAVEALCALCEHHGFDGYLINLEAPVRGGVARLRELLELLTLCLKQRVGPQALCLLYDSLDDQGNVRYQNALTPSNASLFAACDGIFTNYWWGGKELACSASLAGPAAPGAPDRRHDVYCGVDLFARNCSYGAGPGCAAPCRAARNASLSLALFAPGWSLEAGPGRGAQSPAAAAAADRSFWDGLRLKQ